MTNNSAMTRRIRSCGSSSLVPFVKLSTVIDNLDAWLVQGEGSFEPYPNEHDLNKKHVRFIRKFHWQSCSTNHSYFFSNNFTNLGASAKPFPTKLKPSKCPAKGEKMGKKEAERKGVSEIFPSAWMYFPLFCWSHAIPATSAFQTSAMVHYRKRQCHRR